nr:hypothetical protein [uncultured Pseudomonas sp.]
MSKHIEHSSYREKLVEHLFVGDLLKQSWCLDRCDVEVAKPEVDNGGYDLILEAHGVTRHVQLKASFFGSSTATQKLNVRLGDKPSGCLVWIYFDEETLDLGPFLYFDGDPGKPLPSLEGTKVVKHTKTDHTGKKGERPNIRQVNRGEFTSHKTLEGIYGALFGPVPADL